MCNPKGLTYFQRTPRLHSSFLAGCWTRTDNGSFSCPQRSHGASHLSMCVNPDVAAFAQVLT